MITIGSKHYFNIKKYGYLLFLFISLIPLCAAKIGDYYNTPNLACFIPIIFGFVVIPIADLVFGRDKTNPSPEMMETLSNQSYYQIITYLGLPFLIAAQFYGMYHLAHADLNLLGITGWVFSMGVIGSVAGINIGHELTHKDSFIERLIGGCLLASTCYASFKLEHIRSHHVWVATDRDHTTAKYNQTIYAYLKKAIPGNMIAGWQLEAERIRKYGHWGYGPYNQLVWHYLFSAGLLATYFMIWGIAGAAYFLAQSVIAFTVLEIINYVEHYGLSRKYLGNGRYEPVQPRHSWNSDHFVSNLFLLQLQRHSDHHHRSKRRYQALLTHDDVGQLPFGYPTMLLIALCPPLWFKVMNPRVPQDMKPEITSMEPLTKSA